MGDRERAVGLMPRPIAKGAIHLNTKSNRLARPACTAADLALRNLWLRGARLRVPCDFVDGAAASVAEWTLCAGLGDAGEL